MHTPAAVILWTLSVLAGSASPPSGSIQGVLIDVGGGVLPGVTVRIRTADKVEVAHVVTNAQGRYIFPNLPLGSYIVRFDLSGFQSLECLTRTEAATAVPLSAALSVAGPTYVTHETPAETAA